MRATSPWWSAWIVLSALQVLPVVALAGPPASDWFASDCPTAVELHPSQPAVQLLRVLTQPDDPGKDAIVLRMPDGALYAPGAVFDSIQVPPPGPPLHYAGSDYHSLDRIPGLRYAIDACRQTLSIDRAGAGATTTRSLRPASPPSPPVPEPGAYAQVQAVYVHSRGDAHGSALLDGGMFGQGGLLQLDLLQNDNRTVRLDTHWIHDDPSTLTRLLLGDSITRGGSFGRSLRFAGVQWGREFSLRPDLVTFPQPQVADAAALPSAVDVYVDNVLRTTTQVPSGPFALSEVPVMSGAGEIRLVITDLLGRSRIVNYDFYAAPALLRPGLSDYTLEAGFERRAYGSSSLDYGPGFAATTWRRGMNDRLTFEAHVEASARLQVAGAGYALLLPRIGVLGSGLAIGSGQSDGGQLFVSLDRQSRGWSYAAQYQAGTRRFLRIGETRPQSLRRRVVRSSWQLPYGASLSVGWLDDRRIDGRVNLLTFGYGQQLRAGMAVNVGASVDADGGSGDSLLVTLGYAFGSTLSAYAIGQHTDAGNVGRIGVQRNPLDTLDWSARADVQSGPNPRRDAGADWRTQRASLHAEVEDGEDTALRLGLDTGVALLADEFTWTRPLRGPFALVETSSTTPVDVFMENRFAGTTRADAPLLLPDLRPYQQNRVTVSQGDFGIEQRIDRFEQHVTAPGYGGVHVSFVAASVAERRLRLVRRDGTPVSAGSDVTVVGTDTTSFVGHRGETVLTQPPGRYHLSVQDSKGRCEVDVALDTQDTLLLPQRTIVCSTERSAEEQSR